MRMPGASRRGIAARTAGGILAGLLVAACTSAISDEALEAAEVGCELLAEELDRGDLTGTLSAPLVLRQAHAEVEPAVSINEFTAATEAVCPDTLERMQQRIDELGP